MGSVWGLGTTSGVPGGQKRSLYVSGAPVLVFFVDVKVLLYSLKT